VTGTYMEVPMVRNGNGHNASRVKSYTEKFPIELATWLATNGGLIDALLALRDLDGERGAPDAVDAVGEIRRIAVLRGSWELWTALVEGDGEDAEKLL
jgi:hypothetical protein